jgi:5-(carboxyamino)imidazole ribonucleotide synthase
MALLRNSTIGIIGGGQLGRMLAMAAARYGYRTAILEPEADCPAAQVANTHICAPYDDANALRRLALETEVVTYEFENVPVQAVRDLTLMQPVYPPPKALEVSQDRIVEKDFLNSSGIATVRYHAIADIVELRAGLREYGGRGILKTRRMGYDGKGQALLDIEDERGIEKAWMLLGNSPVILEQVAEFECEVSVIAARDTRGHMAFFDVAENTHKNGILATSTVPARIKEEQILIAHDMASKLLSSLDYVGVLGLELFALPDGSLLANEFAPRVHNSGHWTEAACPVSQFEQHIRCVAGLPLGDTKRHSDCTMENLIGQDVNRVAKLAAQRNAVIHLYGKTEVRPGRKMGHVTHIRPIGT